MALRLRGDETGGGQVEEGLTPAATGSPIDVPIGVADTEPGSAVEAPGRSHGRTPGAEIDLERAAARAKLKASLFQIESAPLRVGRFTILSRLGQGGMGVVYAAYDEDLDRKVAVKVVLPDAGSDASCDRMRREAQAMARLSHPNIVTVHEVGQLDEQVYIAMEFVRGRSLEQWLGAEPRSWSQILEVFIDAGKGLHAAHEAGLVHRDFKPQNVMVGEDGSVKVLDFGLARAERSFTAQSVVSSEPDAESDDEPSNTSSALLDEAITKTGALVGTPAFMAPEQHGQGSITARSDQFSFCVALHMALYGEHPFTGNSIPVLMASVCEGRMRTVEVGRVPSWVQAVLRRGLSVEPAERFASMAALLEALSSDPRSRRRRRATAAAVVLGVFGGGFALAQLGSAASDACPDGEQLLAGVWDDERREAVATGLRGSDSPFAEQTERRLLPALDEYARGWAASRTAACEGLRSHQISDLLHERQVACLDRAKAAMAALVEAVEGVDESVVDHAMAAASGLPVVSRCEDPAVVLAELEPAPEAVAEEVESLRQQLSRTRTLEDLGRTEDGRAMATSVVERADALDYAPLRAEALVRRGSIEVTMADGEAADASLDRALWLAVEIGHDAVAAEAAARRLFVRSELLRRPQEARAEVPWARALVARTGDGALEGLVLNNSATISIRQGLTDEAVQLLDEAIEVKQAALGHDHPEVGLSLFNLGYTHYTRATPTPAVAALSQAAAIFEAKLGPWHPFRAQASTVLTGVLIELGRYGQAHAELDTLARIERQNPAAARTLGVDLAYERAKLASAQRRWSEAQSIGREALDQARAVYGDDPARLADVRWLVARAVQGQGRVDEAEALMRRTIDSLDGGENGPSKELITTWVELGEMRLDRGDGPSAEQALVKAQQLADASRGESPVSLAWRDHLRGRARMLGGELDVAASLLRQSLAAIEPRQGPAARERLEAQVAVGELEWAQGNPEGSAEILARVEGVMAEHRAADDPQLAWVRARLARARYDATPSSRGGAHAMAVAAHAVLQADSGWATEAASVSAWLDEHAP